MSDVSSVSATNSAPARKAENTNRKAEQDRANAEAAEKAAERKAQQQASATPRKLDETA